MKLVDLDPRWLIKDGERIGLIFVSPANPLWRQTCFFEQTPFHDQCEAVWAATRDLASEGRNFGNWQPCAQSFAWTCVDGAAAATFDALTVRPSIDGSAGGFWHGHITNGDLLTA